MLNLDEIEARVDAATPGKWHYDHGGWTPRVHSCRPKREEGGGAVLPKGEAFDLAECNSVFLSKTQNQKNARFIAHVREDVPALIARVRELEAQLPFVVKVAAREQRYACVDAVGAMDRFGAPGAIEGRVQNAPAPDFDAVMKDVKENQ